jgi:hypothetical protein
MAARLLSRHDYSLYYSEMDLPYEGDCFKFISVAVDRKHLKAVRPTSGECFND